MVGGGLQDFSVSPSPLGPNWVFEMGWAYGYGVYGTGLDNIQYILSYCKDHVYSVYSISEYIW